MINSRDLLAASKPQAARKVAIKRFANSDATALVQVSGRSGRNTAGTADADRFGRSPELDDVDARTSGWAGGVVNFPARRRDARARRADVARCGDD